MGGLGSGNWNRRQGRKSTVEESLVVGVNSFRRRLHAGTAGSITWTLTASGVFSVGFVVLGSDAAPVLILYYRWRDTEAVRIPVRLAQTATRFGGKRWWFSCPLVVRGVVCKRRVAKLYLPPGSHYFGCRRCHDLTYQSCQEAHQTERLLGRLGFDGEIARRFQSALRRRG